MELFMLTNLVCPGLDVLFVGTAVGDASCGQIHREAIRPLRSTA